MGGLGSARPGSLQGGGKGGAGWSGGGGWYVGLWGLLGIGVWLR